MGLFASLLNSITNASALGYEIAKDQHLTGSQREANQFSAEQVELDRRFQSAEAEKARSWQEDQYLKYNSPAAQVRQYQEAGINPALMFGDPSTPAPSQTSVPSGASASSVTPSGGDVVGMIGQMLSLSKLDSEIKNINADTESKTQSAKATELQNQITAEFGRVTAEASYNQILAEIDRSLSQANLNDYERQVLGPLRECLISSEVGKNKAESVKMSADALMSEWRAAYMKKYDADPQAPPLTQALTSFLEWMNSSDRWWNR